ncbi:Mrp/NBP35 family ATP-binding protein [Bacteroidota bacterium]
MSSGNAINDKEKTIREEERKIKENVSRIKHRIAIFSGKGGVGKTTLSVNLSFGFLSQGYKTGLLDADITGPNVSKMLGITDELIVLNESIIPHEKEGLKSISVANLIEPGQPVIWRGPMRSKIINQFLAEVKWGELDFLLADLPPGTGDEILTIAQMMKPDAAVIVTTPQEVSLIDAERAANMAIKMEIPFVGVVENMSGLICPECNNVIDIFGHGGGRKLAEKMDLTFLGDIPFEVNTRKLADRGIPVMLNKSETLINNKFLDVVNNIKYALNE